LAWQINTDGKPIPNTTVWSHTILQIVSALEHYRFTNQDTDLYKACPGSLTKLRDYAPIRGIEKAARYNESNRQDQAQELKTNGVQSRVSLTVYFISFDALLTLALLLLETITRRELRDVALGLLTMQNGKRATLLAYRDRAMLLMSTSMAMRGDNVRTTGWSDLLLRTVMLINMGDDYHATVCLTVLFSAEDMTDKTAQGLCCYKQSRKAEQGWSN
jgi:hypothetical protein